MRLADAAATATFGTRFAAALACFEHGLVVSLKGELGAGKTALVRAVLVALGVDGPVVSPSYTLIEPYELAGRHAHHMDLYRLADPEELEYLGIREIDVGRDWLFIEWAERGDGFLPVLDLEITLEYDGSGRLLEWTILSERGRQFCDCLGLEDSVAFSSSGRQERW